MTGRRRKVPVRWSSRRDSPPWLGCLCRGCGAWPVACAARARRAVAVTQGLAAVLQAADLRLLLQIVDGEGRRVDLERGHSCYCTHPGECVSMSTRSTAGWGARRQLDMPLPCSLMCRARICTPAELPRLKEVTHANASLLGQSLLILIAVLTGLSALPQASDLTTSTLHSLLRFLLCFLRLRYRLVPASTFPVSKEQVRYELTVATSDSQLARPQRKVC